MLTSGRSYEEIRNSFKWRIPEFYNIGVDICDKHAGPGDRLALIYETGEGRVEKYTFRDFARFSNQFANTLNASGFGRGDRLGILLPQRPETAIAHIGVYKVGGVAVPLFTLFGTDALEYRLSNSEARAVVTDPANLEKVLEIRDRLPLL
ncbi:MAG: AMP-binding protein, partial [Desulfobacterales bacterium]|nr:AMP-binding protein [Desulfobacterales bacterium]